MRLIVLLVLISVIAGCDSDELVYELPFTGPKVVVNCVGVNNDNWQGAVALSRPVLTWTEFPLSGALVKLYEDDNLVETLAVTGPGFGSMTNSPRPDHTYTIEVVTPDHGTATAAYRQPSLVVPLSFEGRVIGPHTGIYASAGSRVDDVEFNFSFQDLVGSDFYEIVITAEYDYMGHVSSTIGYLLWSDDPSYKDVDSRLVSTPGFVFDDKLFDGKVSQLVFRSIHPHFEDPNQPDVKWDRYKLELRHLSREYYDYLTSLARQVDASVDPYAQPAKVLSNVKNGLGTFSGLTKTVTVDEIE